VNQLVPKRKAMVGELMPLTAQQEKRVVADIMKAMDEELRRVLYGGTPPEEVNCATPQRAPIEHVRKRIV
jgi:hypothetical protein